ncbi:hypothetical protein HPB47_016601 [Ixodes persulcatus]|uniref:Uncharacterized protein n=1 Tax=Ixodes persulcatus TaxID=34615 RepID=A0AC60QQG9_IXOPE|nr:hypothetical protein HPB47_016601 [Ixodes persulcatus]
MEEPARTRYRQKLTVASEELPDPLDPDVRRHAFSTDARRWPQVEIGDVYVYLVEGVCFYSREQFKRYKLEDGYNLFLSGKVRGLRSFEAAVESDRIVLVTGEVETGQTLGRYHLPWAVVKKEGTIQSAHCTCMAGLGEACSHVAALYCSALKLTSSSASRAQVQLLSNAAGSRHLLEHCLTDSEDTDTASSISSWDDLAYEVFGTLVDMVCFSGSLDETAAREATLTGVEGSQVELSTRAQAGSDEWFRRRKGRITASVVGVEGVVFQVMGYTEAPNVSSVRWGRDNEVNAKNRFINDEGPKHKGFEAYRAARRHRCPYHKGCMPNLGHDDDDDDDEMVKRGKSVRPSCGLCDGGICGATVAC